VRLVLDTNIFISALISPGGIPDRILGAWKLGDVEIVTSREQLAELADVLSRERMRRWIERIDAGLLLAHIDTRAVIVEQIPMVGYSADPDDNVIIATAIAGSAELLVSGDKSHLLSLGGVEGIPIVSPKDAIEIIEG